jgi:hypothetical protein
MRARDRAPIDALTEERITVPSLGGDGVVVVRSLTFGQKIQMSIADAERRPAMLLAYTVRDEDGVPLMTADEWDTFGLAHDMDFVELSAAAKRVSALDVADAKKD